MLERVLRGHDEESPRQPVAVVVDRHLPLGHRLEQRTLRSWCGPVDLVGQKDVGKHRSGPKLERPRLLVVEREAGDVGGQEIGGALDPRESAPHERGQPLRERRLAQAGRILDQEVPAGEQAGDREIAGLRFAAQRLPQPVP